MKYPVTTDLPPGIVFSLHPLHTIELHIRNTISTPLYHLGSPQHLTEIALHLLQTYKEQTPTTIALRKHV